MIRIVLGIVLILFGGLMGLGFVGYQAKGNADDSIAFNALMLAIFVAGPIAWGIHLIRRARTPDKSAPGSYATSESPPPSKKSFEWSGLNPVERIFLVLVAVSIAGLLLIISAWSAYAVISMSGNVWRARNWVSVPANVLRAEVSSASGTRRVTKYNVHLKYTYTYAGRQHEADRLVFTDKESGYADIVNTAWMRRTMKSIDVARQQGHTIPVFVNPDNPVEAVVDRGMVWGDYTVASLMMILFSIAPFGIMAGLGFLLKKLSGPWLNSDVLVFVAVVLAITYLAVPFIGAILAVLA